MRLFLLLVLLLTSACSTYRAPPEYARKGDDEYRASFSEPAFNPDLFLYLGTILGVIYIEHSHD